MCDTARQSVTDSNTVILQNKPMNQHSCQPAVKSVTATFWRWDQGCRAGVRQILRDIARKDSWHWGLAQGDWVLFWATNTKHILSTCEAFPFLECDFPGRWRCVSLPRAYFLFQHLRASFWGFWTSVGYRLCPCPLWSVSASCADGRVPYTCVKPLHPPQGFVLAAVYCLLQVLVAPPAAAWKIDCAEPVLTQQGVWQQQRGLTAPQTPKTDL